MLGIEVAAKWAGAALTLPLRVQNVEDGLKANEVALVEARRDLTQRIDRVMEFFVLMQSGYEPNQALQYIKKLNGD